MQFSTLKKRSNYPDMVSHFDISSRRSVGLRAAISSSLTAMKLESAWHGGYELVGDLRVTLSPDPLQHEHVGGAIHLKMGSGNQPLPVEHEQRVVAPPPLLV